MSAKANKKLIERICANSAGRSGTTFAASLADDVTWVVTGQYSWSRRFTGKESILHGLIGHFRSLFVDRPRTIAYRFIADDDFVVVESRGDNLTRRACATTMNIAWCSGWRTARSRRSRNIATRALVERVLGHFPKRESRNSLELTAAGDRPASAEDELPSRGAAGLAGTADRYRIAKMNCFRQFETFDLAGRPSSRSVR